MITIYRFAVTETRNVEVEYRVEASSLAEARTKAEMGDTIAEVELGMTGISDRFVAERLGDADAPSFHLREGRTPAAE